MILNSGKAKPQEDLIKIFNKLNEEAVDENKMIRLSYPLEIKELFKEINYKFDILEKCKHN